MWVSARQAAEILRDRGGGRGDGLARRHADRLLGCGLAGDPVVTPAATLYDERRVRELASRSVVDPREILPACPWGLLVGRRPVDVRLDRRDQLDSVRDDWRLGWLPASELRIRIRQHGHQPLVVTVAGHVALGADIVGIGERRDESGDHVAVLDLRDPGSCFEVFRDRRLPTGPGRPWVHWDPQP